MNKLFSAFCLLFLGISVINTSGQTLTSRKHFVYFTDKANSPYNLSNPSAYLSQAALNRRGRQNIKINQRDLPVNPNYVTGIKNLGVEVVYKSKWFNGAVVFCDSADLARVLALPYVQDQGLTLNRETPKSETPEKFEDELILNNNFREAAARNQYGKAYNQAFMIGATDMHDDGFHGEGMTIAIFDAGFPGVNTASPFSHLFQNNQIKGVYDFVGNDTNIYEKSTHGTQTLSCIGAYQPGKYIGTAYKANFYLFITENDLSEHHIEEINWLIAAEYADSAGVDVISSSLGYTTFDYPSFSYTQADMNGNTAISTKAADFAASTGILVVNSAGNEGNSSWRSLGAPSDGDSVMAVAAVDSLGFKAGFSSFGYVSAQKVKPNLATQGGLAAVVNTDGNVYYNNGTSFSCPILAGMATGFWQANPFLTNVEVIKYLEHSATLANNPNEGLGYGIPNFRKAAFLVDGDFGFGNEIMFFPNPTTFDKLNIRFSDTGNESLVRIKIFDRTGRLIQEAENIKLMRQATVEFPFKSGINAGLYYVQVSWADQVKTLPLVKLP